MLLPLLWAGQQHQHQLFFWLSSLLDWLELVALPLPIRIIHPNLITNHASGYKAPDYFLIETGFHCLPVHVRDMGILHIVPYSTVPDLLTCSRRAIDSISVQSVLYILRICRKYLTRFWYVSLSLGGESWKTSLWATVFQVFSTIQGEATANLKPFLSICSQAMHSIQKLQHAYVPGQHIWPSPCPWPDSKCSKTVEVESTFQELKPYQQEIATDEIQEEKIIVRAAI